MMSRLNQLNMRLVPAVAGGVVLWGRTLLLRMVIRYRVPSSPMPRTALHEADGRQPSTADQAEFRERLDGVLTTGRHEATCGQSQRRDHVPVRLDGRDDHPHG